MLKKMGFVAATAAAGFVMLGGVASAADGHEYDGGDQSGQLGLVNLNNIDIAHNVAPSVGLCHDNINVLGVQVPVQDVANGVGVPILSPGENTTAGEDPYNCSAAAIQDGGTSQDN